MRRRFYLLFFVGLFCFQSALGQNKAKIDSLHREVAAAVSDTLKAKLLAQLCMDYRQISLDSAIFYGKQGLALAQRTGEKKYIAEGCLRVGNIYEAQGNFPQALIYFQEGRKLSEAIGDKYKTAYAMLVIGTLYTTQGDTTRGLRLLRQAQSEFKRLGKFRDMGGTLLNIAFTYMDLNDSRRALYYFEESRKVFEKIKEKVQVANAVNFIGKVYYNQADYPKALSYFLESNKMLEKLSAPVEYAETFMFIGKVYFAQNKYRQALENSQKAAKIFEAVGFKPELAAVFSNIGDVYSRQGNYTEALRYFHKSEKIFEEVVEPQSLGTLYYNMGRVYERKRDYKRALEYYQKSRQTRENFGDKDGLAHALVRTAHIYLLQSDVQKATKYCKQATALALQVGYKEALRDCYEIRAKIDSTVGNYRSSLAYYKLFHLYSDSIFNAEKNKQTTEMETKFETEIKEQKIIALEKDRELTNICLVLALILFVLGIFIYYIKWRSNQILKAKNVEIYQQSEEIEAQSEQIIYQLVQLKQLDAFKEAMTAMIVHDLKNPLSSIIHLAEQNAAPRQQNMIRQAGRQMLNLVLNILDVHKFESAEIKLNLSDVLIIKCAKEAVEQVQLLLENKKQQLVYHIPAGLAAHIDLELIERVIVNLLTNAIKYTPNNGTIILQAEDAGERFIKFSVTDTGQGIPADKIHLVFEKFGQFDPKHSGAARSTGLGLTYCKMVVEAHGGTIRLTSEVGHGTTFYFTLPRGKRVPIEPFINDEAEVAVLNYGEGTDPALSEADFAYLRPFIESLKAFEAYEITDIQSILHDVVPISDPVRQWKINLENAVHFCNEEAYHKLLALDE